MNLPIFKFLAQNEEKMRNLEIPAEQLIEILYQDLYPREMFKFPRIDDFELAVLGKKKTMTETYFRNASKKGEIYRLNTVKG